MQSNAYHRYTNGNTDQYKEVFNVLDQLGMSDLKRTFQEHYIQDQTLRFVETEDELKQILREIKIPIGRCIPIIKSWSKQHSQKGIAQLSKALTADKALQASVETADACVQTDDVVTTLPTANYHPVNNNMTAVHLNHQQDMFLSPYAALASARFPVHDTHNLPTTDFTEFTTTSQPNLPYGVPTRDPYTTHHMWPNIPQFPTDFPPGIYDPGAYVHATNTNVPLKVIDIEGQEIPNQNVPKHKHIERPTVPPSPESHEVANHQISHSVPTQKVIVDEREDLAIQQSLKHFEDMERESPHSYASVLNSDTASQDRQLSYGPRNDSPLHRTVQPVHSSHSVQSYGGNHRSLTIPPGMAPNQRPQPPPKTTQVREKIESSQYAKCDDISLDSGVLRRYSSLQNVGTQTLQAYLDSIPESKEYKEAIQCKSPKTGWKALDGKHMMSGKKVAFKAMYWDSEGRMRHGSRVKGADKSVECWRHVEGKAPAGCNFAHSRLGDTLEFICVRCTCERGINEWCLDKMKHKNYIFNLGPYRNLEGGVWKKSL